MSHLSAAGSESKLETEDVHPITQDLLYDIACAYLGMVGLAGGFLNSTALYIITRRRKVKMNSLLILLSVY